MKIKRQLVLALVLGALLGFHSPSFATPMLSLNDSDGNSVAITDNLAGDLDNRAGIILFTGTIGDWIINVSTGTTKPISGTADSPFMDLNSINQSTGTGNTLTLTFSETGFNQLGMGLFTLGGTTQGSVNANAYYDPSNAINGKINPIASLGPFGGGVGGASVAFAGSGSGLVSGSSPYSLTIEVILNHAVAGQSSFDASLQVPEPGSLLLLGLGLFGIGIVARKKK